MIERLVLFGATGDLAGRFLLPALAALQAAGEIADGFRVVGAARERLDDEAFRRSAADRLAQHAREVPTGSRTALIRSLAYRQVDIGDPASVASLIGDEPSAFYLALPPSVFAPAVTALHRAGLTAGNRIVFEKPFGEDLESAEALNALLAASFGADADEMVFRVDHVLGMPTVENLLALRLANDILEPLWNGDRIEQIEILWEETLALEGRAGYDHFGALKDVMQSHMMQVMCLLALEPPTETGSRALRDRKLDVLRSVRPLSANDIVRRTRRARYTTGRLAESGRIVPSYVDEDGVEPTRRTETFAEVVLELEASRWAGTRFVLRTGKALAQRRKLAVVHFRPSSRSAFAGRGQSHPNQLRIGIDGPEDISLQLNGSADTQRRLVPLTLVAPPPATELPAYGRVLLDVLREGNSLSTSAEGAERAWRIFTPVLEAWQHDRIPLEEYPAGSRGPPPR